MADEETREHVLGIIVAQQHGLHTGLRKFRSKGKQAVLKELEQLQDMQAYTPIEASSLMALEKKRSVESIMLLTEKRDGKIKGRAVGDGRKQRSYIKKEDAASPPVSLEGIMITSAIEAHEGREVATIDIPGAYLRTDIDEHIHLRFKGKLAERRTTSSSGS